MKRIYQISLLLLLTFLCCGTSKAQNFGLKTNLLYDATASLNLGVEVGIAPKWTLDISGNYNPWEMPNGMLWKHAMVQPEFRFWFCDRFSRHFLGFHGIGGIYNIGNIPNNLKIGKADFSSRTDFRYEGWAVGAGIAYGYAFILNKHWNLELEIGAGYIYTENDKFECIECGKKLAEDVPFHYFGPTKAAINIVYLF